MEKTLEKNSNRFLEVNDCGRQFLSDQNYNTLRKDGRADWHILYITSGICTTEFEGITYSVGAGNFIIYKPNERQKYSFNASDESVSCYIHFSGTACEELLKNFSLLHSPITYVGTNSRLESIFTRMADEFALKREFYVDLCAALLWEFLSLAGRLVKYKESNISPSNEKSVDKVCRFIHQNYAQNHDIKFFADMVGLSASRFAHIFKLSTGTSPKQYLINVKINMAQQLLERTSLSVAEVAEAVGIDDNNYFSRLFKKQTGQSPLYFRH